MGLFDRKKDVNLLSGNGLIEFVRGNLKNPSDKNVLQAVQEIAKPDADQEHLTKDGELPWGWYGLNKTFTDKVKGEYSYFLNNWCESKTKSPKRQLEALQSFVEYMVDVQTYCYSKNECFVKWFDMMANPEYITRMKNDLKYLEDNLLQLQQNYEEKQNELENLEERAWIILKENNEILQADFLKKFNPCIKNEVSELLYQWSKQGRIDRIKSGRSYMLQLK